MEEKIKQGKLNVELRQNPRGIWYAGNLNINADSLEEFGNLLLQSSKMLKEQIQRLNSEEAKQNKIIGKENNLYFF